MIDPVSVRTAISEDVVQLQSLRLEFFEAQIAAGLLDVPIDVVDHVLKSTPGLLASQRSRVHLAKNTSGETVGYIYCIIKLVPGVLLGSIGSIEEMFVADNSRCNGVANFLLKFALDDLHSRNATRIQLRVLAGNPRARAFWKKNGFVENVAILEYAPSERRDHKNISL